jgi:hypothetical protein
MTKDWWFWVSKVSLEKMPALKVERFSKNQRWKKSMKKYVFSALHVLKIEKVDSFFTNQKGKGYTFDAEYTFGAHCSSTIPL